jgi:hypothetical protein
MRSGKCLSAPNQDHAAIKTHTLPEALGEGEASPEALGFPADLETGDIPEKRVPRSSGILNPPRPYLVTGVTLEAVPFTVTNQMPAFG